MGEQQCSNDHETRPFKGMVEESGTQRGGGHPCHLIKRIRKICILKVGIGS